MYEVGKPKVVLFGIKYIVNWSGRDLKMLRSWFLTGLENGKKKDSIKVHVHWSKTVLWFSECFFFPSMGSESSSLHSGWKKEAMPDALSSCTESLTPQQVEGWDETLFSVCTCSWTVDKPFSRRKYWARVCNAALPVVRWLCTDCCYELKQLRKEDGNVCTLGVRLVWFRGLS